MARRSTATRYISRAELMAMAAEVAANYGTQKEIAQALGVTQPAISQALNSDDPARDSLRARIIRELGEIALSDDRYWRVN